MEKTSEKSLTDKAGVNTREKNSREAIRVDMAKDDAIANRTCVNTCVEKIGENTGVENRVKKETKIVRPPSKYPKMPVSMRAKQFSPFDPLSGFGRAIRKKELEVEGKYEEKDITETNDSIDD